MYEIELMNNNTNENILNYGYSIKEVFKRDNLNPNEWVVMGIEYID